MYNEVNVDLCFLQLEIRILDTPYISFQNNWFNCLTYTHIAFYHILGFEGKMIEDPHLLLHPFKSPLKQE